MPSPGHPAAAPLTVELRLLAARSGPVWSAQLTLPAGTTRDRAEGSAKLATGARDASATACETKETRE